VSQQEAGGIGVSGADHEERPRTVAEPYGDERPPTPGIDITKPHIARIYDYFLGGKLNYAVDREAAEQVLKSVPELRLAARINRRFLIEPVRWTAQEAGVRQSRDDGVISIGDMSTLKDFPGMCGLARIDH